MPPYQPTSAIAASDGSRYRAHGSSPALRRVVSQFFTIDHDGDRTRKVETFPDGCVDIIADLDRGRLFISGPAPTPATYEARGEHHLLGARLKPGVARPLFKVPIRELTPGWQPLDQIVDPPLARELEERIATAPDVRAQIAILESFLRAADDETDPRIDRALQAIVSSAGSISISDLARESGASERNLGRLFAEWVGLHPKQFATIVRFQRVLQRLREQPAIDWATVATELGYSDQPHLIREVRRFAGATPRQLATLSDLFNPDRDLPP